MWDDIIGEPEGIRSTDCAWDLSQKAFNGMKNIIYLILSTICGLVVACCMGCGFAYLAFCVS